MVGNADQTKTSEQLRIFKTLPGLENAEFVRLGSVHRNTFINSPKCLNATLEFRTVPGLFFAGQLLGLKVTLSLQLELSSRTQRQENP